MISYFAIFSAYTAIGQRFYPIPHRWLRLMGAVVIAVALAVIVPLVPVSDLARWVLNLLALAIFAIAAVAIGLARRDEIGAGLQILRNRTKDAHAPKVSE
jgi:uncharacterized membrane protein YbhN (UPF0104 family)